MQYIHIHAQIAYDEVNLFVPAFSISMQYIHVCTKITDEVQKNLRNVLNDWFWSSDLQAVANVIRTTLGQFLRCYLMDSQVAFASNISQEISIYVVQQANIQLMLILGGLI